MSEQAIKDFFDMCWQIQVEQWKRELEAEILAASVPTPADGVVPDWLAAQLPGPSAVDPLTETQILENTYAH